MLKYLSVFSPLLPILIGSKRRFSVLWYYALTGLCFDITISIFLAHTPTKFPVANIFSWLEYVLISFYFYEQLSKQYKPLFYVLAVFFGAAAAYSLLDYTEAFLKFNSIGLTIFHLIYIIYALLGLHTIMREQKNVFLDRSSFFWASVAFLIYASGVLLIFLCNRYYNIHNKVAIIKLWQLVCIFNILKYLLLTLSMKAKEE